MERLKNDPNMVNIFDSTLRDGDQSPRNKKFTMEDKLAIASALKKLGVGIIEAGFPSSSKGEFEAVSEIARTLDGPVICGLSLTKPKSIEKCWEAIEPAKDKGGARIHVFIGTSKIHMEDKLQKTPEQVLKAAIRGIRRARMYTDDVEFSPEDASRSDLAFMTRVVLEAVNEGAKTINIPDTVGFAQPDEYAKRIAEVKRQIDTHFGEGLVIVSAHCHNDLGIATYNTLAAIRAGARQAEVTINGIGERAGNASLEEVVENIRNRPDIYCDNGRPLFTTVNSIYLMETSRLVVTRSGMFIQDHKAIVGKNAYAHASGVHQHGVIRNMETYQWMKPEGVGQEMKLVLNSLSGRAAIDKRAGELGFSIEKNESKRLRNRFKNYADKSGRTVTDVELERIIANFKGEQLTDRYVLKELDMHSRNEEESESTVVIEVDGKVHKVSAKGKGEIGAAKNAIQIATGLSLDFEHFKSESLAEGAEAEGTATISVKNDIKVSAYAESTSVNRAAVRAYAAALNTIDRIEKRKIQIIPT